MKENVIIGTRSSKLALWQANHIADLLREKYPGIAVELRHIATTGDKILDVPLAKIGGKGLFTKELESEMLAGRIDLAVHSLKDMPVELPEGLVLAAVTRRRDPGDALVSPRYKTLERLPRGAKVGTSSLRRRAQLLNARPDLVVSDLRGNVTTRLEKLENEGLDAIVLAVAGLKRLNLESYITQVLPKEICLPAVGQGALAIETRRGDARTLELISFLNDPETSVAAAAERAFLKEVEGGCQVPVGVYASFSGEVLTVEAIIADIGGKTVVRDKIKATADEARRAGKELAARMLRAGGKKLMEDCLRR